MYFLKRFFKFLGAISNFIYPDNLIHKIEAITLIIYSGRISAKLKHAGENISINRPFSHNGLKYISIGDDFLCLQRLRIEAITKYDDDTFQPEIIIGKNVCINSDCHISSIKKVVISDDVLIASRVFITDHYHGSIDSEVLTIPPRSRKLYSKGAVVIGKSVWIGEGVTILPGVEIGDYSIVGANTVVTKSFPKYSVIGGVPARLIRSVTSE